MNWDSPSDQTRLQSWRASHRSRDGPASPSAAASNGTLSTRASAEKSLRDRLHQSLSDTPGPARLTGVSSLFDGQFCSGINLKTFVGDR